MVGPRGVITKLRARRHVLRSAAVMTRSGAVSNESLSLVSYGLLGALIAAVLIAVLLETGTLRLGAESEPAASVGSVTDGAGPGCELTANTPECNHCMNRLCRAPCDACAANGWCLRLYLCVLDCKDEACNRACEKRYPDGKQALHAFAGASGCMASQCRDACK